MICPECKGPGTITTLVFGVYHDRYCPRCHGAGEVPGREPTYSYGVSPIAEIVRANVAYLADK